MAVEDHVGGNLVPCYAVQTSNLTLKSLVTSIEVLMMSLLVMSLGLKFCTSRKDGTVGSG